MFEYCWLSFPLHPAAPQAFRDMDGTWRRIMKRVRDEPLMLRVAETTGLLEELEQCNMRLDVVEKGLNDFLDTKKMAFPRFFFLSNDELLEILVRQAVDLCWPSILW